MPKVLNKHLDGIPPDAVYVGRPSKWGNPYDVAYYGRKQAIRLYAARLVACGLVNHLDELRGKDLVCWCAPLECHADLLLGLANATPKVRARMIRQLKAAA